MSSAVACATVSVVTAPPIYIQAESAVIIWDAPHHLEHFIRQAQMGTVSPDLGFLVPTPEAPELVEADPQIFHLAATVGAPQMSAKEITQTPWQVVAPIAASPVAQIQTAFEGGSTGFFNAAAAQAVVPVAPKDIIAEQDVAGYHATILDPTDTASVTKWLAQNGYTSTPALQAWLRNYAKAGWKITAFRMNKTQPQGSTITTRAIRLSFHTDAPYYPYSEPADRQLASAATPSGRVLHVAVLSEQRVDARKADGSHWPGTLLFAGSSQTAQTTDGTNEWLRLAKLNVTTPSKATSTLTNWVDNSNPRQGTGDLYFSVSPNPAPFRASLIDPALPVVRNIDWRNPIADLAALSLIILVPGIPLYCGWLIHSRSRYALAVAHASVRRPPNRIIGFFGIIWSLGYSMVLIYDLIVMLLRPADAVLAADYSAPAWLPGLAYEATTALVSLGLIAGVFYCGVHLWRARQAAAASRLRETFAIAAMFAGAVGLTTMMYYLISSI